jgi:hypothetical protein
MYPTHSGTWTFVFYGRRVVSGSKFHSFYKNDFQDLYPGILPDKKTLNVLKGFSDVFVICCHQRPQDLI